MLFQKNWTKESYFILKDHYTEENETINVWDDKPYGKLSSSYSHFLIYPNLCFVSVKKTVIPHQQVL